MYINFVWNEIERTDKLTSVQIIFFPMNDLYFLVSLQSALNIQSVNQKKVFPI